MSTTEETIWGHKEENNEHPSSTTKNIQVDPNMIYFSYSSYQHIFREIAPGSELNYQCDC